MRTTSYIDQNRLDTLFAEGEKVKLSETRIGDTFLSNGFGRVELFLNINAWKIVEGEFRAEPYRVISLHPDKQSFGMRGTEDVVVVNLEITASFPENTFQKADYGAGDWMVKTMTGEL